MQKKRGESVKIENIIRETQPEDFSKLKNIQHTKTKKVEKLTERDLKELMGHSSYKRKGGAIRQVKLK
ncbi:MAG: hypothetical protein RR891_02685 [Clostridium sp.]